MAINMTDLRQVNAWCAEEASKKAAAEKVAGEVYLEILERCTAPEVMALLKASKKTVDFLDWEHNRHTYERVSIGAVGGSEGYDIEHYHNKHDTEYTHYHAAKTAADLLVKLLKVDTERALQLEVLYWETLREKTGITEITPDSLRHATARYEKESREKEHEAQRARNLYAETLERCMAPEILELLTHTGGAIRFYGEYNIYKQFEEIAITKKGLQYRDESRDIWNLPISFEKGVNILFKIFKGKDIRHLEENFDKEVSEVIEYVKKNAQKG